MEVPKELKNEIWEYCRENDITNVEDFMLNMLRQGFNIEKYGEKPPFEEGKEEKDGTKEKQLSDEELKKEEEKRKEMEKKMEEMEGEIKRLKDKSGEGNNKEERDIYGEHGSNLLD